MLHFAAIIVFLNVAAGLSNGDSLNSSTGFSSLADFTFRSPTTLFNQGVVYDIGTARNKFNPIVVGAAGQQHTNSISTTMTVFTSSDRGTTWSPVSSSILGAGQLFTVAISEHDSMMGGHDMTGSILIGGRDGDGSPCLFSSLDSGATLIRQELPRTIAQAKGAFFGSSWSETSTGLTGYVVGSITSGTGAAAGTAEAGAGAFQQGGDFFIQSVAASYPVALRSPDGGVSWGELTSIVPRTSGHDATLRGVASSGPNVVVVGWDTERLSGQTSQAIWYSKDTGSTFQRTVSELSGGTLYDVSMASDAVVYACGAQGGGAGLNEGNSVVLKSVDGGKTWSTVALFSIGDTSTLGGKLFGIYAITDAYVLTTGVGVNQTSRISRTVDTGETWEVQVPPLGIASIDFFFSVTAASPVSTSHSSVEASAGTDITTVNASAISTTSVDHSTALLLVGSTGTASDGRGTQLILIGEPTESSVPFVPSSQPSSQPSGQPSSQPSGQPSGQPSSPPTSQPSIQAKHFRPATTYPLPVTIYPSSQPSSLPSGQPSSQPSPQPSNKPTKYFKSISQTARTPAFIEEMTSPSSQPSCQPSNHPSIQNSYNIHPFEHSYNIQPFRVLVR